MIQIISNNRSKTETNTYFLMDIKKLMKECYEELCDHKSDNLDETNQFLFFVVVVDFISCNFTIIID